MRRLTVLLLASASPLMAQEAPLPAAAVAVQTLPAPEPTPGEAVPETPAADPSPVETGEDESDLYADEGEDIVVTASAQPRGSVVGDIAPEVVLDARTIRGYGAATIGDLLTEIAPLTGSIQGRDASARPIILLSGRRISSFAEIRDLPPEAIARVDILPEEVALKYGYRPDSKVINIVLRGRFNAVTAELEGSLATDGGRESGEADLNYLRIAEGSRFSIDGEISHAEPLFESDRRIDGADPDRTLLAETDAAQLSASYNRTILGNVSATATGELTGENSLAALGRSTDGTTRLLRDRQTRNQELGVAFTGDAADLRWSLNTGYTRGLTRTQTDRDLAGVVGRDRARSVTELLNAEAVANGDIVALPAGDLSATFRLGGSARDISSSTERAGALNSVDLSRDAVNGQLNVDLPITSRRRDVLGAIGDLSLNVNGGLEELSDFGTLRTFGYGLNWEPIGAVRLIASVTHEEGAPTLQQLGNPVIETPNVRVIDVTRGETVDVTLVEGGNGLLSADDRRVIKLGLTLRPLGETDLTLRADYTDARTDNPIASFPAATPEIEAAFPDRFSRDADGRLFRIDSRPVNLQSSTQRSFRWGFNWSETVAGRPRGADGQLLTPEQLEEQRAARRDAREAAGGGAVPPGAGGPPPGEGFGRGGGGFGRGGGFGGGRGGFGGPGGFGGGRQGRVNVALFHTWRLEDSVRIRDGVAELDLLDGSATGGRGGQPRHTVELRAGYTQSGLGVRVNADWQSGSRLLADPGGAASPNDLSFSALSTVNLRFFADLGQQRWISDSPFLRGARLTLAVDNLFNERLEARDAAGFVPLGYQADLLDPLGRSVRLELRKLFF